MTFDMQDAMDLERTDEGEIILVTLKDGSHVGGRFHNYDHRYDALHIDTGWVERKRIENVVVVSRMERMLAEFERQGICGDHAKPDPDEHILHGRKTTKQNLQQIEGDPSGI